MEHTVCRGILICFRGIRLDPKGGSLNIAHPFAHAKDQNSGSQCRAQVHCDPVEGRIVRSCILTAKANIIDYKSLVNHVFKPIYSATRIKERPEFTSSNIVVVPEGDFLCFKARLLADDFGAIHLLDHYLRKLQIVPRLVVACEFEDNLREYTNTPYEVQILI